MTAAERANDGVGFLVGRLAEQTPGEPGWVEAVQVTAAAVAAGWLSWEQVAVEIDGLTGNFEGLTGDAARARFGSGLDGVDDAGVLAALQTVDQEATEPRCGTCDRPVGMFLGRDAWQHLELWKTSAGWSRVLIDDPEHPVVGPVWRYGPAAVPVDQVGVEPAEIDFDAAGRDRVAIAGAELLAAVHEVDFHYYADGSAGSWGPDGAAAAGQLRDVLDGLERAATAARAELDAVERIARVRAAHRRRSSACEPGGAGR